MSERRYRRLYITGGTIVSFFLALQLWGLQVTDVSGDIYCTDTCTSYFDVINPTYRSIYIYNKESIKLDFSPEIKDYQLYVKYYRKWVPMDFTMETRLGNVPKDRIYTFVFPRYSIKHFKLVGKKETWQDIKWTFSMPSAELDPLWSSGVPIGDKVVKELCEPIYKTWTDKIKHYKNCTSGGIYDDINKTTSKEYTYVCLDYIEEIPHINEQVDCKKTGKVNVSGKIISNEDWWCQLEGNKVCCVHNMEGGKNSAWWATDTRLSKWCRNLITDKVTFNNALGVGKP